MAIQRVKQGAAPVPVGDSNIPMRLFCSVLTMDCMRSEGGGGVRVAGAMVGRGLKRLGVGLEAEVVEEAIGQCCEEKVEEYAAEGDDGPA